MGRKPKILDIEAESQQQLESLRDKMGKPAPLRCSYVRGVRPILVAPGNERAVLKCPDGATNVNVPIRDLVDNAGYWRK